MVGKLSFLLITLLSTFAHADLPPHNDMSAHSRFQRSTKSPSKYYSSMAAFGASYTDNAHPRPANDANTLRTYLPYGGRYTDGPVAVEYMVEPNLKPALPKGSKAVVLNDWAEGGTYIDNSLGAGSNMDTKHQIANYLAAVAAKNGSSYIGSGRVLHYVNTGINPVIALWLNAYNANMTSASIKTAKAAVSANVKALAKQLRSINTNKVLHSKAKAVDFVIVGIPPLEIVPTVAYQCNFDPKAINLMKVLAAQFNNELFEFAATFKKEVQAKGGKSSHYNLAGLWYDMTKKPKSFGITIQPTNSTCYNSSNGAICDDSQDYLYFDTLHPVTSIMEVIAKKINAAVLAA